MKNTKMKKFLAILLVLVMMLSFVACGGDDAETDGDAEAKKTVKKKIKEAARKRRK